MIDVILIIPITPLQSSVSNMMSDGTRLSSLIGGVVVWCGFSVHLLPAPEYVCPHLNDRPYLGLCVLVQGAQEKGASVRHGTSGGGGRNESSMLRSNECKSGESPSRDVEQGRGGVMTNYLFPPNISANPDG